MFFWLDCVLVKEFTEKGNLKPIDLGVDFLPLGRAEDGVLEGFPKDVDFSEYLIHNFL